MVQSEDELIFEAIRKQWIDEIRNLGNVVGGNAGRLLDRFAAAVRRRTVPDGWQVVPATLAAQVKPRLWRHAGTGEMYAFVVEAVESNSGMASLVVYQSLSNGRVWARSKEEFFDGRFEEITS